MEPNLPPAYLWMLAGLYYQTLALWVVMTLLLGQRGRRA